MRFVFSRNIGRSLALVVFASPSIVGAPAYAENIGEGTRSEARWVEAARFDLQTVSIGRGAGAASEALRTGKISGMRQASPPAWPRDELGPRFAFEPRVGGPVVEFAALGAGKKGRPGLAHIALDWDF